VRHTRALEADLSRAARLLVVAGVLACERAPRVPGDSTASDTTTTVRRPDLPADWAAELGTAFLVPTDSDQTAILLHPAESSVPIAPNTLFTLWSPGGDSMATQVAIVTSDSQVCGEAPTVRLKDTPAHAWAAGLRARKAAILPMDSIEAMTPMDSSRTVADLARMASLLPGSGDARFAGLPFIVVSARRFTTADRMYVAAHLVRRLPQEATPLEERVFFIAERDRTAASVPYATTYHLRSAGTEESADHYDALVALRGDSTVYLLLTRDQEARTSYELLERMRTGGWRVRWVRALEC
jgi:hypothetical protein